MKNIFLKLRQVAIICFCLFYTSFSQAQYKAYKVSIKGDTINVVDKKNLRQGPWVIHVDPLRGEPGYESEGVFVADKKEGEWRLYTLKGDFVAVENYKAGGKDGLSQYYSPYGDLLREENWRGYNPDHPYDTIPIYGTGNNEILSYKIVKAEPYSVKNGTWTWYEPSTGRIMKVEKYDRGHLIPEQKETVVVDEPMKKIKPKEVMEYEKKNSGKKKVKLRNGETNN
ncbi:MAG: hypothetical protein ABI784_04690 [Ginsengibacter sp.]